MAKAEEQTRRAYLSVSRSMYEKLQKASKRTGAPISILVELSVAPAIGIELSPQAKEWAIKLAARKAG